MKKLYVLLMIFSLAACIEELDKIVTLEGCMITKAGNNAVDHYVTLTKDNKDYGIIIRDDLTFKFWWEQVAGASETVVT